MNTYHTKQMVELNDTLLKIASEKKINKYKDLLDIISQHRNPCLYIVINKLIFNNILY